MDETLEQLRRLCLALPEATERTSHGHPAWFVREKPQFASYHHGHHDVRPALWCAAPPGAQEAFIATRPEHFFRPPYVGHRGWLGVYLDGDVDWDDVTALLHDAYVTVAPKRLAMLVGDR
ncbi:MmcQ/YjbR family DNA-binding protein [soil metagenome]